MKNLLEYRGYHARIELSEEDNCFVGSVMGINDSLHFHGQTVAELKEAFQVCIDDYLEMCKAFGKTPEKEYKGSFNIRIPPELHKQLELAAAESGTTLNQYISKLLSSRIA